VASHPTFSFQRNPTFRIINSSQCGWPGADIASDQKGLNQRLKRFFKFNLICLAGLILNVLILNFFFNIVGIDRYLANLIVIAVVTIWNFWMNLKLSWRVTEVKSSKIVNK
jgi:dolichol-phosphate mannosyltransferase